MQHFVARHDLMIHRHASQTVYAVGIFIITYYLSLLDYF